MTNKQKESMQEVVNRLELNPIYKELICEGSKLVLQFKRGNKYLIVNIGKRGACYGITWNHRNIEGMTRVLKLCWNYKDLLKEDKEERV